MTKLILTDRILGILEIVKAKFNNAEGYKEAKK
jgi:hypothetical protein